MRWGQWSPYIYSLWSWGNGDGVCSWNWLNDLKFLASPATSCSSVNDKIGGNLKEFLLKGEGTLFLAVSDALQLCPWVSLCTSWSSGFLFCTRRTWIDLLIPQTLCKERKVGPLYQPRQFVWKEVGHIQVVRCHPFLNSVSFLLPLHRKGNGSKHKKSSTGIWEVASHPAL